LIVSKVRQRVHRDAVLCRKLSGRHAMFDLHREYARLRTSVGSEIQATYIPGMRLQHRRRRAKGRLDG